mgnify:CR=1 FL=1|tara:strand:- start:2982 stop:3200 length:219 start_codon:yes stop_codon:yes gene_type:complete
MGESEIVPNFEIEAGQLPKTTEKGRAPREVVLTEGALGPGGDAYAAYAETNNVQFSLKNNSNSSITGDLAGL